MILCNPRISPLLPLFLAAVLLILAACGSGPKSPRWNRDEAMAERRPLGLNVVGVYDAFEMNGPSNVSHLIEVDVENGPDDLIGKRITLPYDEWNMGAPPPKPGAHVTTAPYDWVHGRGDSKGRPQRGFPEK